MAGKLKSVQFVCIRAGLKIRAGLFVFRASFLRVFAPEKMRGTQKAEIRESAEGTRNYRVSRLAAKQQNAVYAIISAAWGLTRFKN